MHNFPLPIGGTMNTVSQKGSAPNFYLKDINGNQFSLNQQLGKVVVIHFMAVGCGGQIYSVNEQQLRQLGTICGRYCGEKPFAMVTVAVATCENSKLEQIRTNHNIDWIFGNDYDDKEIDIVHAYVDAYSIKDETILLIDKTLNVVRVYTEVVTADALSIKINQLLETQHLRNAS
jgi:hypothetical protein